MHNIFYTWNEAIQNSYDLAEKVQASGFLPDRVVGIIRGGVISGTIISYFLGKEFQADRTHFQDQNYYPRKGYDSTIAKSGTLNLVNNEMIVYKTEQVAPKYLVEFV